MWIALIIFILLICFVLPDIMLPLLGFIIGGGILLFIIGILIDELKSKKNHKRNNPKQEIIEETVPTSHHTIDKSSSYLLPEINDIETSIPEFSQFNHIKVDIKGVEDDERERIQRGFELDNILIDGISQKTEVIEDLEGTDYVKSKLNMSEYPLSWDKSISAEIRGDILLISYRLPSLEELPDFLDIEYKKEQPITITPNEKRIKTVWTDTTYKIVIRSMYELFSSSRLLGVSSISFNGTVQTLDLSTGNEIEKCILSVIVQRADFDELDLSRLDAKQCFRRFKGVSAHDLSTLTPIPPLMLMTKEDKRFIGSYDVMPEINVGENLAAMDWRDFENLIRELFEKEFSADGSEVKITRASKDGGVDAVVFDSDPIRGGKIIIQAKRYTNVVGVSAVRDLYGTVMNEGATKGILVTTSDYGADSYNFVKDKPLTLLNGANLLHLLEKHGCKAHINIVEAKKFLSASEYE